MMNTMKEIGLKGFDTARVFTTGQTAISTKETGLMETSTETAATTGQMGTGRKTRA